MFPLDTQGQIPAYSATTEASSYHLTQTKVAHAAAARKPLREIFTSSSRRFMVTIPSR